MSDDTQSVQPPRQESGRVPSRGQQRRRQRSVFQYIAILFAAAFLLLLYTFAMERRQNEILQQENQEHQQQSVSAVQTLEGLMEENAQMKEQLQQLEDQLAEAQRACASEQADKLAAQQSLQDQTRVQEAMDWFWQIDEAFVLKKYTLCRTLIGQLEASGLVGSLPENSVTENGRFSPKDRFQEIRDKVL